MFGRIKKIHFIGLGGIGISSEAAQSLRNA